MNYLQYEVLLRVLEVGTLSKVAEEMKYTQSGLSRMINSIESELGMRLVDRDRGGVRLTAEGELLIPYIRDIVSAQKNLEEAVNDIKGLNKGLIRIGTFNSASSQWLPGMIKEFTDENPGMHFELVHGTDEYTRAMTEAGRLDMCFTDYPTKADLEEDFLVNDQIVAIFSENDPYAKHKSIKLSELENMPYVELNEGVDDEITRILNMNDITLDPRFSESDDHAVIAMVEKGLGTSLMSEMMLRGFTARIAKVPLDPPAYRQIGIACRDKSKLSIAARAFMEHAEDWIKRNYSE